MTVTIFAGVLLAAMALGMPIAFALMVTGTALMWHQDAFDSQIIAQNMINGADNFPLLAVPFFLLAGELMNAGGLSRRVVEVAGAFVGHIRGGLGYVAVFAAIVMASLSGSAVADTAAITALLIPMMRNSGYNVSRAAGLMASAGVIAPLVPPSLGFIVFGVAAGLSITKLFFAGIFPALLMGASLVFTWWLVSAKEKVKPQPRKSIREMATAFINSFWAFLLPVIIIGGLKSGVFTPTEASVTATVYSLLVGLFVYRELKFKDLYPVFLKAAKTSSVVMFLVAAALVSAWLITVANIPEQVTEMLEPFLGNKLLLMLMMMVLVVIVGTALDFIPTILILTPVLMPLVNAAGIDPIYFGVLFIMNNAIGLITPPVGTALNTVCGVARIRMDDVVVGVLPFLLAELAVLFLLVFVPSLVTIPARWFY